MHALPAPSSQPIRLPNPLLRWMAGLFAALLLLLAGFAAQAAPPPANSFIDNQASVTYLDSGGTSRTVLSNTVRTTVLQVAALTLTANLGANLGALNGTPGGIVYFPHVLTNTGNGLDTFNLTAPSPGAGAFNMTGVLIYLDNGSGAPTGPPITATTALPAGGVFRFIVAATLPAGATAGQTNAITVTATSTVNNTINRVNTDTTTVVTGANVTFNKSIGITSGAPGTGPYTYTIAYNNLGNSTATSVVITDILPTDMNYNLLSSRWSVTGATPLSDTGVSSGTAPNTITANWNSGTRTLTYTINQVLAGASGNITFTVNVGATALPGVRNNTATAAYNGPAALTATSNAAPFTVTSNSGVTLVPQPVNPVPTATAGSVVTWTNLLTNTGTATDTFDVTIQSNNFPAGTTFQLYRPDGLTLLTDSNGNSTVDTGPVSAGGTFNVILKATLPANAPTGGPHNVVKRATSVTTPSVFADATDILTAIVAASVDLTNDVASPPAGTLGAGVTTAGEATAQKTNATNAGTTTTFTLVVRNIGNASENYDLTASTVANHSTITLPSGWSIVYKEATGPGVAGPPSANNSCTATGATVVNTGAIAVGAHKVFCAEVSVPTSPAPADTSIYFRVRSSSSGASDIKHDRVTINTARSLTLTPNGSNQTVPGGSVVYSHTLTNTGNVLEGNTTASAIALTLGNNQSNWTATVHYDANGNGLIDSGENPITTVAGGLPGGLAAGASMRLLVRVNAAAGAQLGDVNVTTLTATTTNGTYTSTVPGVVSVTDTTTIVSGNLQLVKRQALDANCDGTPDTAYAQTAISALPNGCVLYEIVVTNAGSTSATNVVISDATPTFTKISVVGAATGQATMTGGTPLTVGATGTVSTGAFTLAPSQTGTVTFGVRIDQ